MDNIFALTETEFFKKYRSGTLTKEHHFEIQEFLLRVHEVTQPSSPVKTYALEALVIADIEFRHIKSIRELDQLNHELCVMVETAHSYVLHKIEEHKSQLGQFTSSSEEDVIKSLSLQWNGSKTDFVELCYGLKIGECFGGDTSLAEIVRVMSKAFNVEVTPEYARRRFHASKFREEKSETALLEKLIRRVRQYMGSGYKVPEWVERTEESEG